MHRNVYLSCLVVSMAAALGACSSAPSSGTSGKTAAAPDKIQGKALIADWESTAADSALNGGGPSVYLVDGLHRYRLFFNHAIPVEGGKVYSAEGVYAQKMIDDIGDPDKGKNGYPLQSSCDRVVRTAWPGLAFDVTDGHSSVLRTRVKRHPARPIFLVRKLVLVTSKDGAAGSPEVNTEDASDEITVPAEKQRALLIAGPTVQSAPLWEPAGGNVRCKVTVSKEGKISGIDTGAQLCEAVPWSEFRYQPTVKHGHPVGVKTEVEVRFEPRT